MGLTYRRTGRARLAAVLTAMLLFAAGLVVAVAPTDTAAAAAAPPEPNVVPGLQNWTPAPEDSPFVLTGNGRIVYNDERLKDVAHLLADELGQINGMFLKVVDAPLPRPAPGDIFLNRNTDIGEVGPEGYRLSIATAVQIEGDAAGVFYGTRTLLQMLKQGGETRQLLPGGTVTDHPKYPERGLMLDTARKFLSIDFLKRYIQQMSWFKMNLLHLHLSDDEAFRLESTVPGLASPEHYTKAEMADLVVFAKRHHVTIIPEIDVPGHAASILAARPDLGHKCSALNNIRRADTGHLRGILDLSNPDTVPFVKALIDEYLPLFGGEFHFGADEYPTPVRSPLAIRELLLRCAELAARANELGYSDPGDIYRDFIDEITEHIENQGARAWAWTWYEYVGSKPLEHRPVLDAFTGSDVRAHSEAGSKLINSTPSATYVMPGRRVLNTEWMYETWRPWQWEPFRAATALDPDDSNLLGLKTNVWNAPGWVFGLPEAALDGELTAVLKVHADKSWGGPARATYAEFVDDADQVGNAPGYGFGLIANYRFEEGEHSTSTEDTSGAGKHGRIYGLELADGKNGSAMHFGGGADRMHIGAPDVSGEWTAGMWVKREQRPGTQSAAVLLDSDQFSLRLEQAGTPGRIGITAYGLGAEARGGQRDDSFDYSAPVGEWVHLGFVGNPATTRLYVDGELVDTLDRGFSLPLQYLGGNRDAFAGLIDDVKVYDTALDAEGMRSLYQGLVVHYPFEDTTGITATDNSGLGNHGVHKSTPRVPGHQGQALEFNGGEDMLYTAMPGIADQWTASMWVNREDLDRTGEILLSSATSGYSLRLKQVTTGRVGFTHTGNPADPLKPPVHDRWDESFDYVLPADGNWRQVVFVGNQDGTSLYVDGKLTGTSPRRIELPTQFIGVAAGTTNALTGDLDEVKIFDRALSAAEILQAYEAEASGATK